MKISWYDHLYVGDKAKKKRYQIIQAIRNSRLISGAYVITPSLSGNNVLDIYPAMELSAPWYRNEEFFIIGIAADYWEALEVTRQIIDELYRNTGGFDLAGYLNDHSNAPCTSGRDNQARNMSEHVPEAGEM